MKNSVHPVKLDFVCPVKLNAMPANAEGWHCSLCNKQVYDYSPKSLAEINAKLAETEEQKCIRVHGRHLENPGKWFNWLNRIEHVLQGSRYKQLSVVLITLLLFLTGCRSKRNVHGGVRHLWISPYLPAQIAKEASKAAKNH